MPTLDEVQGAAGGVLHDALAAGIADISQQTTVCFDIYHKVVLPLDGFVFWLRASSFEQAGSIHWMAERGQEEAETVARNTILFTTQEEVQDLNTEDSQILVVGEVNDRKYAFVRHGWFYPQAGVWHYQGDGVNRSVETQLVDDPAQLDTSKLIVSDSLPAWLQLVSYDPVWISWPQDRNPHIPLYPSYLVPDNLTPPYGAVHIEPSRIEALQSTAMWLTPTYTHYQLTRESVRVTLYGCNNDQAADFLDLVEQYTLDTDAFGLMNMPTLRDGKKPWAAGMVIAQEKTIDFEVSYIQTRINDIARQLITEAVARVLPDDQARTAGLLDPVAQADIQAGPMVMWVAMGGSFDASGDLSGGLSSIAANTVGSLDATAGVQAVTNQISIAAATVGAQAGLIGSIGGRPPFAGQVGAVAGISAACSVMAGLAGRIDAVAG